MDISFLENNFMKIYFYIISGLDINKKVHVIDQIQHSVLFFVYI